MWVLGNRDNQRAIGSAHHRKARVLLLEDPALDLPIKGLAVLPSTLGKFGDRLPRAVTSRNITGAIVHHATASRVCSVGCWGSWGDRFG